MHNIGGGRTHTRRWFESKDADSMAKTTISGGDSASKSIEERNDPAVWSSASGGDRRNLKESGRDETIDWQGTAGEGGEERIHHSGRRSCGCGS